MLVLGCAILHVVGDQNEVVGGCTPPWRSQPRCLGERRCKGSRVARAAFAGMEAALGQHTAKWRRGLHVQEQYGVIGHRQLRLRAVTVRLEPPAVIDEKVFFLDSTKVDGPTDARGASSCASRQPLSNGRRRCLTRVGHVGGRRGPRCRVRLLDGLGLGSYRRQEGVVVLGDPPVARGR